MPPIETSQGVLLYELGKDPPEELFTAKHRDIFICVSEICFLAVFCI